MLNKFLETYALLFAKPLFTKWNKLLFHLSIRGMGILNYRTENLRGEKDWLKKYLKGKKNPVIVDIGANVGEYTKGVLKINPSSEVISIEPHPKTFLKLTKNIQNENVTFFNIGIGEKRGKMRLFDYAESDGSSHATLYEDVIVNLHKSDAISHEIDVDTLENILVGFSNDIDLLKIDTEGNEFNVLKGAKKLFEVNKIKAIHFEFNEMNIVSKSSFKDFWDLLNENFIFYRILPRGRLLPIVEYSSIDCEIYHYQNLICINKN